MKHFSILSRLAAGFLLCLSLLSPLAASRANADSTNLVPNPGLETSANGQTPDSWTTDTWGNNSASFAYVTNAHSGTHAVQTTVTNYQSGDAKWLFAAVGVTGGTTYSYSDWYEATTSTNLWAQFQLGDGTTQYQFLVAEAASTTWNQAQINIAVPANVTAMSVFHVLAANGSLTLDDISLAGQCTPTYVNGLPNGDFEDGCVSANGVPVGWTGTQYGTTAGSYALTPHAYQGSEALSFTDPTDGAEVGITAQIQTPQAGQRYQLDFAQAGDTYVYAYATFGFSGGSSQAVSLMSVPQTHGVWSLYTDNFVVPANAISLSLTIATSGAGSVTLDAVSLVSLSNQNPPSFTSGMVSLTFDDGDATAYTKGLPVLNQYGFRGTYYLNAGSLNTSGFMSSAQVKKLAAGGEEIASHLYHHSDMTQLDTQTIISELTGNKTALQHLVGSSAPIADFASPYGSYTSGDIDTVMQYQASHRTTDNIMNTKANLNPRQIHAYLITPNTTYAQFTALLNRAAAEHDWLVLVYHDIATSTAAGGEAGYNVTPTMFKRQMAALSQSGLPVQTVAAALPALQAQL